MFCTTLRKRPEFAPIIPSLASSKSPKWQEKSLETYDIALPLPRGQGKPDLFRLLLLSESDIDPIPRIERLCHINGDRQIGVVFLLKEQFNSGNGMTAYLNLQANLLSSTTELPINLIPLNSLDSLIKTLTTFHHQLMKPNTLPKPVNPVLELLPHCSSEPPMPEHTLNVMSDLCGSLKQVSQITSTEQGKLELEKYLEKGEKLDAVVQFWEEEHYVIY